MTEIRLEAEADIQCPAEKIFDVIIDFRGQDRWLTKSAAFRGTTEVSSSPVTRDDPSRAWTVRCATGRSRSSSDRRRSPSIIRWLWRCTPGRST